MLYVYILQQSYTTLLTWVTIVPLNMIGELCTLSSRYNSLEKFEFKLCMCISQGAQKDTLQIKKKIICITKKIPCSTLGQKWL